MKLAPFLAVIVALNASYASADILAGKVASSAGQLRSAISGAGLPAAAKTPIIAQLLKILNAAKCTSKPDSAVDCSQASQDQLATAQDDFQKLRDDFTAAVRQAAATQALAKTFAAAAVQVRSAISNEGLTPAAQAPLITQYLKILSAAKCTTTANGADCSQASQDQLATAQTSLQQLRLDFTAAHNQAAATQALAKTFAAAAVQVRSTIAQSGLTPAAQAPLITQYLNILSAAKCTSTAGSADCSQASQAQLTTAQDALQQLRYGLTAALKPAAVPAPSQTPPANASQNTIAQPFVTAAGQVRSAIANEGLTAAAQAPLIAQFQKMVTAANCTSTANGLDCSKASPLQLAIAQAALQQLRNALATAVSQTTATQALDQAFAAAAGQVRSAIKQSGLAPASQSPFFALLTQIMNDANCTATATSVDCSHATQGQLTTAQAALQGIRYGLTAALKQTAATQASYKTFASDASHLVITLKDQRLTSDVRSQLTAQLGTILTAAKCTLAGGVADCSQAAQAQLATAQAALQKLRSSYTAAVQQAAASLALSQKTFAASAGMVLNALNDKKMYAVQGTFYSQIDKVMSAAKCTRTAAANGVDCSQATQVQLATAQSGLDTISLEVGKIAATLQASGGLALSQQTFAARAAQLLIQINAEQMAAGIRTQFIAQFANDLSEAGCTNTAGVDCSRANQSQLAGAQHYFDNLSSQLSSSAQPDTAPKTAAPGHPAAAGLPTSLLMLNP